MTPVRSAFVLLRPAHWVKNVFVLAGIFFAGALFKAQLLGHVALAFAAFCLASSAAYAFNDALDSEADGKHPRKRLRPVASGTVSAPAALALAALCGLGSLGLACLVGTRLFVLIGCYGAINVAYSRWLKHVVLIDVFCIASGFSLRLLAGTWGIGIPPSQWFVLCAFLLSLFLGFSKRYAERMDDTQDPEARRAVVEEYSPEFLRTLLSVTLACTLIAYGLYTLSPQTLEVHGTKGLIYTLPVAALVMFRYLYLVMERGFGENLASEFLRDRPLIAGIALYAALTGALLIK